MSMFQHVENAVAAAVAGTQQQGFHAFFASGFDNSIFCLYPIFIRTDILFSWSGRQKI